MSAETKRGTRGFTLVELLVVVSIIALLIAILLPSLKRARCQAKRIACNANTRGIAQAGLTYAADDRSEMAIPVGPGDGDPFRTQAYYSFVGFGGRSGIGETRNVNTSIWSGQNLMGAMHRPLNNVIYKGGFSTPGAASTGGGGGRGGGGGSRDWTPDAQLDLGIYKCPGDKGFPGYHMRGWKESNLSGYDYFGTSYAANPYLIGPISGGPLESNSIYLRPMSRVPNPTNTVLYWEFGARYAVFADNPADYPTQNSGQCFWPWATGKFTARGHHCKDFHFNVSFGDGHASWIKIQGYGLVEIGDHNWPPNCPGQRCICILQRGLGWQVDTLPADLLPTHKIRDGTNGTLIASRLGSGGQFEVVD